MLSHLCQPLSKTPLVDVVTYIDNDVDAASLPAISLLVAIPVIWTMHVIKDIVWQTCLSYSLREQLCWMKPWYTGRYSMRLETHSSLDEVHTTEQGSIHKGWLEFVLSYEDLDLCLSSPPSSLLLCIRPRPVMTPSAMMSDAFFPSFAEAWACRTNSSCTSFARVN